MGYELLQVQHHYAHILSVMAENGLEDEVLGFETLVELPRSGEIYKRDGWDLIGQTKGYTCKREGGYGTDGWTGQRVWNTVDLKPKHVFVRICG